MDLQLTDRGGQVHVAVRSADPGLESALRRDLGTLVDSLERAGFRTHAATSGGPSGGNSSGGDSRPTGAGSGEASGADQSGQSSGQSGGRNQQQPRRTARPGNGAEATFSLNPLNFSSDQENPQ